MTPPLDVKTGLREFAGLAAKYEAPEHRGAVAVRLFGLLSVAAPVHRVLFMVGAGINRPWLLEWHTEPGALEVAVRVGLVGAPLSEEFAYRLTDAGHDALAHWYQLVSPRRENPDFKPFWDVVTLQ